MGNSLGVYQITSIVANYGKLYLIYLYVVFFFEKHCALIFMYAYTDCHFRRLVRRLLMTACDLCTSAKPWYIHITSVKKVFEEFYLQVSFFANQFCL